MAYQKINWANGEAGNTPLNANNLNKMDNALDDFENRIGDAEYQIGTLETTVAGHTTAISEKMDKNNPTGSGTLEIMKVKTSALVAKDGNLYLPNAARYTANDTETFPKIADKFDSVDASISSHSDSIWNLNTSVTQLNNNKLNKSGEVKISGGLEIESSTGIIGEEPSTSYINGFMLQIPQAEFSEDISVLTDSNDAVVNVGSVINTMKSDIQELKDNVGFEITSASPLHGCSASSIVGIDVEGCSSQSGTPTPTNPIQIVDASGDVVAHTVNLFDASTVTVGRMLNDNGEVVSLDSAEISDYIEVIGNLTYTLSLYRGEENVNTRIFEYDANKAQISRLLVGNDYQSIGAKVWSVTTSPNAKYVRISTNINMQNIQFESGSTKSDYSSYGGSNKITLPTLRSVGTVKDELIVNADGSGQIIRRIGHIASYNGESITTAYMSTTGSLTTGATVNYVLPTSATETLTSSQVASIRQLQTYSGTTIIDSALDVKSVTYHAGVKEYIDWRFEQLEALMIGEV